MTAIATLHGFDPETGKTTTDVFRSDDEHYTGPNSPYHRAEALRNSVTDDFPDWVWAIGQNEEARALMTTQNMRALGFGEDEWTNEDSLKTVRGA